MTSLLTNLSAIQGLQVLKLVARNLDDTQRRISTGLRIGMASDGPAKWSTGQSMKSTLGAWQVIRDTVRVSTSFVETSARAASVVVGNLSKVKEKLVLYSGENLAEAEKSTLRNEIELLIKGNDQTVQSSSSNGVNLLTGKTTIVPGSPATRTVDYVFCLDISGSMGGHLNAVRSNIIDFANRLLAAGEDARFSFVTYSDVVTQSAAEPLEASGFYTDAAAFKTELDGVSLMGGGDLPESGLEALQLIRTMPFRPGAERQVVMITDATVHSAEDGTGSLNTVTDTVADLSADGVIVTVAGPSVPDPRLQAISTGTGGSYHNVNDPSFFTSGFGLPSGPTVGGPLFSVLCSPEGQTIDIRHESLLARDLGIASLDFANEGAALRQVEGALRIAIDHAAYLGTSSNRLRDADDFADTMRDVYSASIGAIVDANMEEESARLAALQVQSQIAIKALSIANQDPKLILSLLQPGQ